MKERLTVGVVQPELRPPEEAPMEATKKISQMMIDTSSVSGHFDLFLLPELCPVGYSKDTFHKYLPKTAELRAVYGQIDHAMAETAVKCQAFVCYGTIGWKDSSDGNESSAGPGDTKYFIQQKVADPSGNFIASYNKIHLCDYGDCNENRFFSPGSTISTFDCHGWTVGIMICADIRYPLLCRRLALQSTSAQLDSTVLNTCQVVLQPACFSRDLSFRTWKSFRETRAVENGVYFVATNYAGDYYGEASVTPPWVDEAHEPEVWGTQPGVFRSVLEKDAVKKARESMPYYRYLIRDEMSPTFLKN